ncbi:hypothetical protein D3C71_2091280 [compost metagenome]
MGIECDITEETIAYSNRGAGVEAEPAYPQQQYGYSGEYLVVALNSVHSAILVVLADTGLKQDCSCQSRCRAG